jgi:hypothetical protein
MDEKLKTTIAKIAQLSKQNPEFEAELRKALGIEPSANGYFDRGNSSNDVRRIREVLEIRANASLEYIFVKDERTRAQLIIDNLRMENAALKTDFDEKRRFYEFCVNAFYQIENITNYYLVCKNPIFEDLWIFLKDNSKEEKYQYKLKEEDENVSQIPIAFKLNAVCNYLFPGDKFKFTLSNLRQVRNEGEHRCSVIFSKDSDNKVLYNLYRYNSINDIRSHLIRLSSAIEFDLRE